ncbi:BMC domain-containing protein [Elusimicrobiota bacterium]
MPPFGPFKTQEGSKKYPAIALIEFSSIAEGITAADAMVKKAPLDLIEAGTVQPGKYLVLVAGDVASVDESFKEGLGVKPDTIIDSVILPDVDQQVHDAIFKKKIKNDFEAVSMIEASTVASVIDAADAAVKGAQVKLLEMCLADGLGGKSFALFGGKVEDAQAAVDIGISRIQGRNADVHSTVIPRIDEAMASRVSKTSRFFEHGKK